jgi:hypothetical protein
LMQSFARGTTMKFGSISSSECFCSRPTCSALQSVSSTQLHPQIQERSRAQCCVGWGLPDTSR